MRLIGSHGARVASRTVLSGRTIERTPKPNRGGLIMSDLFALYVDGEMQDSELPTLSEGFRVQVEGGYDGGADYTCERCGDDVESDGSGYESGEFDCSQCCGTCGRPLDERYGTDANDATGEDCDGLHTCADNCEAPEYECDSLACNGVARVEAR